MTIPNRTTRQTFNAKAFIQRTRVNRGGMENSGVDEAIYCPAHR